MVRQPAPAVIARLPGAIVIFDLGDVREPYLHNLAVGTFYFDTRCREGLCGFHATDHAPYALTVARNNLNIVFSVKRL